MPPIQSSSRAPAWQKSKDECGGKTRKAITPRLHLTLLGGNKVFTPTPQWAGQRVFQAALVQQRNFE
jgi:hypothetical protein